MPFYIAVAGTKLYKLTTAGVATVLTLPSSTLLTAVTIDTTRRPRIAVLGKNIIIGNAASRSVWVDPNFVVRPLMLQPPSSPLVLAAGATGTLTGNFKAKYTFIIKDPDTGALLAESDFSPASAASGAITSKLLLATSVSPSQDPSVTHRRLYRTTTGPGTTYFPWVDIEGNVATSIADALPDAAMSLLAAPDELGSAPGMMPFTYMTQLVEWKGRLWGVGDLDIDTLRYSGVELQYGWPSSYGINIPPVGFDRFGITGMIRRRDELGVGRRDKLFKIIGSTPDTFERKSVHEGIGIWGADTNVVIKDVGHFLGENGVYTWGANGVDCISDGTKVRKWFTTDSYFNRAMFANAVGRYNAKYDGYELFLAAAGSSVLDRWVVYDRARGRWWGPHKTTKFTTTYATGQFMDSNELTVPVVGAADGVIYLSNQTAFNDDGVAIPLDLLTGRHSENTPDIEKLFRGPSFIYKPQTLQGNLAVAAIVGGLKTGNDETIQLTMSIDQRLAAGRQRFSPIGKGQYLQFKITESTLDQGCELYGYEVPNHELGRR